MKVCAIAVLAYLLASPVAADPSASAHLSRAKAQRDQGSFDHLMALRNQGRIEEFAAEERKGGMQIAPGGFVMLYQEYAEKQWGAGHLDAAIAAFRGGIRHDPQGDDTGILHYDLGIILEKQRHYKEAADEYRSALAMKSFNTPWTHICLADTLERMGQSAEADQEWRQVLATGDADERGIAQSHLRHPKGDL